MIAPTAMMLTFRLDSDSGWQQPDCLPDHDIRQHYSVNANETDELCRPWQNPLEHVPYHPTEHVPWRDTMPGGWMPDPMCTTRSGPDPVVR